MMDDLSALDFALELSGQYSRKWQKYFWLFYWLPSQIASLLMTILKQKTWAGKSRITNVIYKKSIIRDHKIYLYLSFNVTGHRALQECLENTNSLRWWWIYHTMALFSTFLHLLWFISVPVKCICVSHRAMAEQRAQ